MSVHISAEKGQIAEKVLLPGDPLRAKHIAQKFFENPVCHNEVRGMLGYTGTYKGKRVSVQGTGMGMPSISIYANELMEYYGAKRLIRVGTCGTIVPELELKDLVIASAAHTDSNMNRDRFASISFAPVADFSLIQAAYTFAMQKGLQAKVGPVFTSDQFYDDRLDSKTKLLAAYGTLAAEMETAELYTLAAKFKAQAITLLTVSDNILTGARVPAEQRQNTFDQMVEIALEII